MHNGRNLVELANELQRQSDSKRDFLAPCKEMEMRGGEMVLSHNSFPVNPWAHRQLATYTDIPFGYYERMMQYPALLDANVNHWLHNQNGDVRMVRTLDNRVRGIVSNRYRPLENFDLSMLALPIIQRHGAQVVSAELTEKRLYIKCVLPSLRSEVIGSRRVGDIVEAGLMVSNSEIGAGSLRVEPFMHFLACLNGMVLSHSLRKYHIGKQNEADDVTELLSTEAREADDKAFWLKVRDILERSFDPSIFQRNVDKINQSVNDKVNPKADLNMVMEVVAKKFVLSEDVTKQTFNALIEGGDLSRFGLSQALTSVAGKVEDYEMSTDLERIGGRVIELPRSEWEVIANASAN